MATTTTTATIKADIVFNQQQSYSYSTSNLVLQGSTDYTISLNNGSGADYRQTDSIYNVGGLVIGSGATTNYDLKALEQPSFGSNYTVNFTGIKGMVIRNHNTGQFDTLTLKTTGTNAFTNLLNGGSGGLNGIKIAPGGAYFYSDPYFGTAVATNNKIISIGNEGNGTNNTGIAVSIIIAGTTGLG